MNRTRVLPILSLCLLLADCKSDKKDLPPIDKREEIPYQVPVVASSFPDTIKCQESFKVEKVKVTMRKPEPRETDFSGNCVDILKGTNMFLRMSHGVVLEMDISNYKGVKTISILAEYANTLIGKPSEARLYGFDGELIDKQNLTNYLGEIRFQTNLDKVKRILFVCNAETTDVYTMYLMKRI